MVTVIILGVVMWCLMMWIKRRQANNDIMSDVSQKLPKDFKHSKLSDAQKTETYQEARKRFLEKRKKSKLDIADEALIRHQVIKSHGHVNVPPNEGAFALSDVRMKETQARRRVREEYTRRIEALGKATNKDEAKN